MSDLARLTVDELLARKGELAYAAQMAALEALPLSDDVTREGRELDAELARRGVDSAGG